MPDLFIGLRKSIRCFDGHTRTGSVVFIHPEKIFAVLEFENRGNKWRESFFLRNEARTCHAAKFNPVSHSQHYTPAEDAEIMQTKNFANLAKRLGRTECAIEHRKTELKAAKYKEPRKRYTQEEDRAIMIAANLAEVGRKLGRSEPSIWLRKKTLSKRKREE